MRILQSPRVSSLISQDCQSGLIGQSGPGCTVQVVLGSSDGVGSRGGVGIPGSPGGPGGPGCPNCPVGLGGPGGLGGQGVPVGKCGQRSQGRQVD